MVPVPTMVEVTKIWEEKGFWANNGVAAMSRQAKITLGISADREVFMDISICY